ncbi:MAG: 3' terminal RNA ribose 2'-O-methyltransferase Hen1 [Chloroflexota bacterium]|nr:3' terminal RNA ribose 2'-O-methyltransferase Hen1 [Chloroflexota bacterium]
MLLTITTTHPPATDLGYLLHKNPARCQTFPAGFGQIHVFYPEANDDRCTAALLLDVDPVALVRKDGGGALEQYVNDRPYVASSFLSVAISSVLGTAMTGRSKERQALADTAIPLEVLLAAVPARGGEAVLRGLFEPLGYSVTLEAHPLDPQFPDWGGSPYYTVRLSATVRLADLLAHLYVLIPVLDDDKHYWVGDDEVEKLLRHGAGWLAAHPQRELIAKRYLKRRHSLVRAALARLVEDDVPDPDAAEGNGDAEEAAGERPISLHTQRLAAVVDALRAGGAARVLDLGCGEGRLIELLLKDPQFTAILGMDVAARSLEIAQDRLHLDRLPSRQQSRVTLMQGSLLYRDARLAGYDAAAVVEVIEHLDPPRLAAFERVLFAATHPRLVVVTTPNAEYNVRWPTLPAGHFRHRDHRFEWTRAEFHAWAEGVAVAHGYHVAVQPIGPADPDVGAPSQMAVFTLTAGKPKTDSITFRDMSLERGAESAATD